MHSSPLLGPVQLLDRVAAGEGEAVGLPRVAPRSVPLQRFRSAPASHAQTRTILSSFGIKVTEVDGAVADNKEERSRMWAVSEKRAVYPQVFLESSAGELTFVGAGEDLMDLNDAGTLKGLLAAAPREAE